MTAQAGVLFDVDGTLVDTTYVHTICWSQALAEAGFHPPMAQVHRAVGMGADLLLPHVLGVELEEDVRDRVVAGHGERFVRWHDRITPLPGARDLLEHCNRRGLSAVLASSSGPDDLAAMRRVLGADRWVTATTSAEDVDTSKPSPDVLAVALERARLTAAGAVMVGDAVWDGQAAGRAGITFVGVESGGTSAAELRDAGAVAVFADPAALLAYFERSPLAALVG